MAAGAKKRNIRKRRRVMNLGGRPPKSGERYENGAPTKAERARRAKAAETENKSMVVAQRQQHLGLSEADAQQPSAPLVSWRWLQSKQVQSHHHEAAVRFAELWFGYLRAIDDENSRLKRSTGGYVDPEEQAYIDRCKRIRSEFDAIRTALLRNDNFERTSWWRAAITIAIENREVLSLQGDFRQAMNCVHRILIAAERKAA